jgi:hypothetical protein
MLEESHSERTTTSRTRSSCAAEQVSRAAKPIGSWYTRAMIFDWNPNKAAHNLSRHGVSFAEAATVFDDVLDGKIMNLSIEPADDDELRDEYDLTQLQGGVRSKYVQRYRAGTNLVRLAPDVAAFPNEEAVNAALRLLLEAGKKALEQAA